MLTQSSEVREAVAALRAGAVVAYPTEAVFGLGCDPNNARAVARLFELKGRPQERGFVLIGANYAHLATFVADLSKDTRKRIFASWPGPYTWIVPRSATAPAWLSGAHTGIAVRVTAHPLASALCSAFGGALVSTSANKHGESPARDVLQVHASFGDELGYVLAGELGGLERPTPIRDAITGELIRS